MIERRVAVTLLAGIAGLAALASGGCSIQNPDFCCSTLDSCRQVGVDTITGCHSEAQPYCDDEGEYGPARACIADPGTSACTGPADCATAALPRCDVEDTGTCVGCESGDDCARFGATPLCEPTTGACVACVTSADCAGARPVCGGDHVCRTCAVDGECAAGVCARDGTCPAADAIVHVDPDGAEANVECTAALPCRTLTRGIAAVTPARRYVKMAPASYGEVVVIEGKTVEIAATGADLTTGFGNQTIDIRGGDVTIVGLRVRDSSGTAVRCTDGTVALHGVDLDHNAGRGVESIACMLTVERSRLRRNFSGGASVIRGQATIRNTFITANGSNFGGGGVFAMEPAGLTLEFVTIADNTLPANSTSPQGLFCLDGSGLKITNDIIVGSGANQIDGCSPTYTISNEVVAGMGNAVGRPTFVDATAGDFHLRAGSMGIDAADPAASVAIDYDGEARPNGGRSDLGADELH